MFAKVQKRDWNRKFRWHTIKHKFQNKINFIGKWGTNTTSSNAAPEAYTRHKRRTNDIYIIKCKKDGGITQTINY